MSQLFPLDRPSVDACLLSLHNSASVNNSPPALLVPADTDPSMSLTASQLRGFAPVVAPSMLKCDYADLSAEVAALESAGARLLHWDIMDGHFVPNMSYGAMVIADVMKRTSLLAEAHLMISDPAKYLDAYVDAGCDLITFHIEAEPNAPALAARIREAGRLAGICVNPGTPASAISDCVGAVDNVLVMSVEPGFGGQSFMPDMLDKVREVRGMFGPDVCVSIDGGIGPGTIGPSAAAGCDLFVVGSAIFGEPEYAAAVSALSAEAAAASSTEPT